MKPMIIAGIILILTGVLVTIYGVKQRPKSPEKFHLKVESVLDYWKIAFTEDSWRHTQYLMQTFDITSNQNIDVPMIPVLLESPEEAIQFAEPFITYNQCIEHNDSVKKKQLQLIEERKKNPIEDHSEKIIR